MKLMRPVAMLCALGITIGGVTALAVTQGSQEDPLITLSYLESVLRPDLEKKVDQVVAENEKALTEKLEAAVPAAHFQSKSLTSGQSFTPGAGREILVISGPLTSVGTLSDTTDGKSVAAGATLEANHHYLTLGDNAGCKATGAAEIMSR